MTRDVTGAGHEDPSQGWRNDLQCCDTTFNCRRWSLPKEGPPCRAQQAKKPLQPVAEPWAVLPLQHL
jgi:hypothetical protein